MFSYNKYKDTTPEKTVQRIEQILAQVGLTAHVEWTSSGLQGVFSNRVTLFPTTIGTNGKGTDEIYSLASGYAELIERLENGVLMSSLSSDGQDGFGFLSYPDEKKLTVDELINQNDPFTRFLFGIFLLFNDDGKRRFLSDAIWHPQRNEDTTLSCIPYAFLSEHRVVYLPVDILMSIYGSNGMAAGNSMEEALVQGISEIMERYTHKAVIDGTVPPEIPREYLNKLQISELIRQIEKDGQYRVRVLDCSLGRGIPATAVVISDLERGSFGVNFSSHPSFNVSVERAFTEAFQGSSLQQFTSMNRLDSEDACHSYNNYPNLMKVGFGSYPLSFLAGEPSYEFTPWEGKSLSTNKEMLAYLLRIIHQEGYEVLIRDSSHLGFPAYQVIIPGMSEIFPPSFELLRETRTHIRVVESLEHFPELSDEEAKRLLLFLRYKENSVLEHDFSFISGIPLADNAIKSEKVCALLYYKRGEFEKAIDYFARVARSEEQPNEKLFYRCCAEYARLKLIGASSSEAFSALQKYYPVNTAEKVHNLLSDASAVMSKVFKPFQCFDCENCCYSNNSCSYREVEKIRYNIKKALSKSTISQHSLLRYFEENYKLVIEE